MLWASNARRPPSGGILALCGALVCLPHLGIKSQKQVVGIFGTSITKLITDLPGYVGRAMSLIWCSHFCAADVGSYRLCVRCFLRIADYRRWHASEQRLYDCLKMRPATDRFAKACTRLYNLTRAAPFNPGSLNCLKMECVSLACHMLDVHKIRSSVRRSFSIRAIQ